MIARMHELVRDSTHGYDNYLLDEATRGIGDIIDDISVWYTRRSRERLKGDAGEKAKHEAYETLTYVLVTLAKVMAPVMPFIAERMYQALGGEKESVHLERWPEGGVIDKEVLVEMKKVRAFVSLGLMNRTESKISVKQPLQSVTFKETVKDEYVDLIKDELNVKDVLCNPDQVKESMLDLTLTDDLIQEGNMRTLIREIQDARKTKGLSQKDSVVLYVSSQALLTDVEELMSKCNIREIKESTNLGEAGVAFKDSFLQFEIH
jgi:isoleucyl-tRNA synthetase